MQVILVNASLREQEIFNEAIKEMYRQVGAPKLNENGIKVEIAMQHTDSYAESTFSYVNNIQTPDGGTHEIGFKSGLTKVMSDLAVKTLAKNKNADSLSIYYSGDTHSQLYLVAGTVNAIDFSDYIDMYAYIYRIRIFCSKFTPVF